MKRIHRESADIKKEDLEEIRLAPTESNINIYVWKGSMPGPQGSVYKGGVFEVLDRPPSELPVCRVVSFELLPSHNILMTSFRFSTPKVLFKSVGTRYSM